MQKKYRSLFTLGLTLFLLGAGCSIRTGESGLTQKTDEISKPIEKPVVKPIEKPVEVPTQPKKEEPKVIPEQQKPTPPTPAPQAPKCTNMNCLITLSETCQPVEGVFSYTISSDELTMTRKTYIKINTGGTKENCTIIKQEKQTTLSIDDKQRQNLIALGEDPEKIETIIKEQEDMYNYPESLKAVTTCNGAGLDISKHLKNLLQPQSTWKTSCKFSADLGGNLQQNCVIDGLNCTIK